jgi:hypothetical protein
MATISYKSFNVESLKLSVPEENKQMPDMTKYQLMSWPRYLKDGKEVNPQIQGPWMKLFTYGIGGKLDKNRQPITNQAGMPLTDRERGKIKIPLKKDDPECVKLFELLSEIDKMAENEREKIWGDKKKANAYKYQPMIRQAAEDPDAAPDTPKKPDYFTIKFDFDNATGNIKTKVYQNADGDRTELNTPTLDDVTKYIKYQCEFRPVFALCKLFASKAADDSGKRKYGFGLKLKHVEVKPSQMSAQDQDDNAFVDDEDDEFIERRVLVTETKKKVEKDEDEEDEEDEEDDEEDAPKPTPKAKASAKAVKKMEVEEEDEDDAPKPTPKARRNRAGKASDVI